MQTIIRDFLQHRYKYAYFLTDLPFSDTQRAAIQATGNYSKTRSDAPYQGQPFRVLFNYQLFSLPIHYRMKRSSRYLGSVHISSSTMSSSLSMW